MMYSEFLKISGQEISFEQYSEKIEPMYNAMESMTKFEFIDFMMPVIKELAKQHAKARRAKEIAAQKTVFITNGHKTPNRCYYMGVYAKQVGVDVNVSTGRRTVKVRELTDEEHKELARHQTTYLNTGYDFMTVESEIEVGGTNKLVDNLDNAVIKWVKR